MMNHKIILIAGLTASGKSRLALDIACAFNEQRGKTAQEKAVIINADSMQVYKGLRILTARPDDEDLAKIPHYLYGFVDPACRFSTGAWLNAVEDLLKDPQLQGKTLIFVGGTGLYFHALLEGLADIPPVSSAVRQEGQALLHKGGTKALYAILEKHDPQSAQRLNPQDSQRILRAWEVWRQTGKPLSLWQKTSKPPLIAEQYTNKFVLLPAREQIYARINSRVDKMIEQGVMQEVAALMARGLDPQLPVMKAAGRAALAAVLANETDLPAAIAKTKQETRHYAKRQRTWFNNRLSSDWQIFTDAEGALHHIFR